MFEDEPPPPEAFRPVPVPDRVEEDLLAPAFLEPPVFLPVFPVDFPADFRGCLAEASPPPSRRCLLAASTRLPTPRPSRASWVGVDVDPEIFFSFAASPPLSDELFEESAGLSTPSFFEVASSVPPPPPSSPREGAEEPPTSTAAPIPIRRRSFRFRHSGQVFSGAAVIDWKSSKAWPQASQT